LQLLVHISRRAVVRKNRGDHSRKGAGSGLWRIENDRKDVVQNFHFPVTKLGTLCAYEFYLQQGGNTDCRFKKYLEFNWFTGIR
jgi:hypothetical protein